MSVGILETLCFRVTTLAKKTYIVDAHAAACCTACLLNVRNSRRLTRGNVRQCCEFQDVFFHHKVSEFLYTVV